MRSDGHHVHRALDALVGAAERPRHGAQQGGLADADIAFQQHVAPGEEGDGEKPDRPVLAHHGAADRALETAGRLAPIGEHRVAGADVVHGVCL